MEYKDWIKSSLDTPPPLNKTAQIHHSSFKSEIDGFTFDYLLNGFLCGTEIFKIEKCGCEQKIACADSIGVSQPVYCIRSIISEGILSAFTVFPFPPEQPLFDIAVTPLPFFRQKEPHWYDMLVVLVIVFNLWMDCI